MPIANEVTQVTPGNGRVTAKTLPYFPRSIEDFSLFISIGNVLEKIRVYAHVRARTRTCGDTHPQKIKRYLVTSRLGREKIRYLRVMGNVTWGAC